MKKIGILFMIVGIAIMIFYNIYKYTLKTEIKNDVDGYIENTSINEEIVEEVVETTEEEVEETKNEVTINYRAVLEIPSINLKSGIVDTTSNFYSLYYSISADLNGKYPDEYGNFILYAHAGRATYSFFKNLSLVNINDDVYVYYNGIKYHYVIFKREEVEKNGKVKVISTNKENYITLISCISKTNRQVIYVGKFVEKEEY